MIFFSESSENSECSEDSENSYIAFHLSISFAELRLRSLQKFKQA